jgi:hypothetical protein
MSMLSAAMLSAVILCLVAGTCGESAFESESLLVIARCRLGRSVNCRVNARYDESPKTVTQNKAST